MNKRTFSKLVVLGGGASVGVAVGIPAILSALSPSLRRREEPRWQPVGPIDGFPAGKVTEAVVTVPREDWARSLREMGVFVMREEKEEIVVFSRSCTDLGCPITLDSGSGWFFCPCHGGVFSRDGRPQAGPPKIPLYRFDHRIRGGMLEIDLNSVPPMI